ncbi:MAG: ABC transporter permease [Candidatus Micrarchaeia archaeon]
MKLHDMIIYSVKYLRVQRLRSWLTIIGIVMGVATIVTLVSISEGVRKDVESQMSEFGSDMIIILPVNIQKVSTIMSYGRRPTAGKLYDKDYEKIKNIPGISMIGRAVYSRTSLEFKEKGINTAVIGIDSSMFDMWPNHLKIESGRIFNDNEKRVVVLGNDAANVLFGDDKVKVNSKILIGGKEFRVVGILEKVGTSLSQTDDAAIYIPFEEGRELFAPAVLKNEISMIYLKADEGYDTKLLKEKIEEQLVALHRTTYDDKDFSVVTSDMINDIVEGVLGALTLFLLLISLVAALVGGIGISNTMFMSVLDRTREIGILKSLGAKRSEILMIFMIESVIIGFIGGMLGIAISIGILEIAKMYGIPSVVTINLVVTVIVFSVLVGATAGVIPAYNASKIDPIEAIRY